MSSKALPLVGSASIAMVTWVPVYRTCCGSAWLGAPAGRAAAVGLPGRVVLVWGIWPRTGGPGRRVVRGGLVLVGKGQRGSGPAQVSASGERIVRLRVPLRGFRSLRSVVNGHGPLPAAPWNVSWNGAWIIPAQRVPSVR